MGLIETKVTIPVRREVVYGYLRHRYEKDSYKKACVDTSGYVPRIECCQEDDGRALSFWAAGRDAWTGISMSGWVWGYDLTQVGQDQTEVRVWYRWGWFQTIISLGLIRYQASNETAETVLALEALALGNNGNP